MQRIFNFGLLVSSLFCYLEWADKSAFLFEVEYALFFKSGPTAESLAHPLILLPLLGQALLLFSLFRKQQNTRLSLIGMAAIGLLVIMIFLTGILSGNGKIIFSTIPFIIIAVMVVVSAYKRKRLKKSGQ